MSRKKYSLFSKGDVIRTNPEKGFYGIAVVLDEGQEMELSPGHWSYPMCHIAITPLLFQFEVNIDDIDISTLKPMTFLTHFKREDDKTIPWRAKLCIDIYTIRNKSNLPVIGNIDQAPICESHLAFTVSENGFHLCGDVDDSLGREAYINFVNNYTQTEEGCQSSCKIGDGNI